MLKHRPLWHIFIYNFNSKFTSLRKS